MLNIECPIFNVEVKIQLWIKSRAEVYCLQLAAYGLKLAAISHSPHNNHALSYKPFLSMKP